MSDTPIFANAFGGQFPVCSEEDKVAIEAAYKKAIDWTNSPEGKAYDSKPTECACAIIARLLDGSVSYGDMVTLGIDMARSIRSIYLRKTAALALVSMFEQAAQQPDLPELRPPFPGKKEWVN